MGIHSGQRANAVSEAANLAIELLAGLEHSQDAREGTWRGADQAETLQTTLHVAQALAALDLAGITGPLLEPARDALMQATSEALGAPPQAEPAMLVRAIRAALARAEDDGIPVGALEAACLLLERHAGQAEARAAAEAAAAALLRQPADGGTRRADPTWSASAVRLLSLAHGPALREAVLEALWARRRAAAQAAEMEEAERLRAELLALARQSIRVDLAPPQRITGTRARGELYRLRFSVAAGAAGAPGLPASGEPLRLLVKKGSPDVLARAIRRYSRLPEPLKALFARHAENQDGLQIPPGYLLMQDLAAMRPLSEALAAFDRGPLDASANARLASAAGAVAGVLRDLHGWERRPSPVGCEASVLYLTPMIHSLSRVIQPQGFPEFSPWLEQGVEVNGLRLEPFARYVARLARFEAHLRAPALGYGHGDCHSRNLMLDEALAAARLVDIETLSGSEDYLADYGLLIEDLALYQSLPYGAEPGRVAWDEIEVAAEQGRVRYPPFPQRSDAAVQFQRLLLGEVKAFAGEAGDAGWRERLWLAVARGLLLLAGRQLASQPLHPYRRAESRIAAGVSLAEALRLLHELAAHLEGQTPLPDVPFAGGPDNGSHARPPSPPRLSR